MKFDKIYCINLKDNDTRWAGFRYIKNAIVERIDAVDARSNPEQCLRDYGLKFSPFNVGIGLYFYYSAGAVGCFLSHYKIWQKMLQENISCALIVEDDIEVGSLIRFLNENKTYKTFDCIQLTKRIYNKKTYTDFHGSESYILSQTGARKLIESVKNPSLLSLIDDFEEWSNIKKYFASLRQPLLELPRNNFQPNTIVAPSDRIFTLCCHSKCDDKIRLNYSIDSCINLDLKHSKRSDISQTVKSWGADSEQIKTYFDAIASGKIFHNT